MLLAITELGWSAGGQEVAPDLFGVPPETKIASCCHFSEVTIRGVKGHEMVG